MNDLNKQSRQKIEDEKTKEAIEDINQGLVVSHADALIFVEALINPPEPNAALIRAFEKNSKLLK